MSTEKLPAMLRKALNQAFINSIVVSEKGASLIEKLVQYF